MKLLSYVQQHKLNDITNKDFTIQKEHKKNLGTDRQLDDRKTDNLSNRHVFRQIK